MNVPLNGIEDDEINGIELWLDEYYKEAVRYERSKRLGKSYNVDIIALDIQAEAKEKRLEELKAKLLSV